VEGSGKGTLETEDPALDTPGTLAILRVPAAAPEACRTRVGIPSWRQRAADV